MDNELILNLREALKFSPNNIPLRLTLAEALFANKSIPEAEAEYKFVLENQAENVPAKTGLAKVFFEQQKYCCNRHSMRLPEWLQSFFQSSQLALLPTNGLQIGF